MVTQASQIPLCSEVAGSRWEELIHRPLIAHISPP